MNNATASEPLQTPVSRRTRRVAPPRIGIKFSQVQIWGGSGLLSSFLLFAGFLVNGSDFMITFCLCFTWLIALVGVGLSGGFKTLTGWFTFFPFFHYLLFSLSLKAALGERAEDGLHAPETTALTFLIYFTVVALAGVLARRIKLRSGPLCPGSGGKGFYTALAWVCFIVGTLGCLVAAFASWGTSEADNGQSIGGAMGIAHFLIYFQNFSVGIYAYSVWRSDSPSLLRRPTFWLFFLTGTFLGMLGSAKGATTEPLAYLAMAGVCARGFKFKGLLVILPLFVVALLLVYPVLHYARGLDGARTGSFRERLSIVGTVLIDYLTDSKSRDEITGSVNDYAEGQQSLYLSRSVGVFDRFIMIGPADLLISGVKDDRQFHGFHLFKMGAQFVLPRFLLPDKPDIGASEELAEIAGTRNMIEATHATWGIPASLYFSFGLPGVLLGGFAVQFVFLTILRLFFGEGVRSSVWFPLLIVRLNGLSSCGTVDGLPFTVFWFICIAYLLYLFSKYASRLRAS